MKHSNFKTNVHNLVLAAMFLALALVLPFLTGQIPQIGGMLLPMHLPVFLCGLICGWRYGAVVGFCGPADADGALRNAAAGGRCGHGL
ncbi:MAG: ECF transporter S component [Dysosmobacter welbionis]